MKQLTIAVPSYNSESFLDKCIESFIYPDGTMDERLQVIIVNDGSTDGTLSVGLKWNEKYPENIIVIDKENGGHGSGINAGIDNAQGRYYKVIDSDDWILTENLKSILGNLEKTAADVVVTGFHTVNIASGVVLPYGTGVEEPKETTLEAYMTDYESAPAIQSFHGLMYNVEFYKNTGIRMSEKVFFEDQEYAILPFGHVKTMLLLPEFFYEYQIGSANQSVNFENQAKRSSHFLQVMEKMISYHKSCQPDKAQDQFMKWRLYNGSVSYLATVLVKGSDKADGRAKAKAFFTYLLKNEPEVAAKAARKYKVMSGLNRVPGAARTYGKFFNSKAYSKFKKRWVK